MRDIIPPPRRLRQNWVFGLGLVLSIYFAYHLIQGERSYIRLIGLNQAIARETNSHEKLKTEHVELAHRVQMLRPGSINRDFLEERARSVLGYRAPQEMDVILGR